MNMIIKAENRIVKDVRPKNGRDFSLAELQKMVNGCIEIVDLNNGFIIVCNEEGKLEGLPVNQVATSLAITYKAIAPFDCINGDVLLCESSMVK